MKRSILLSLAGLTLVAACTDNPTRPTDAVAAPQGQLKPLGPVKDDIANTLETGIDAVAEVMPLNVGGANGTTTLYVSPANDDGKNGCNLTGSTTLSVSVTSSNPAVATASLASNTFTSCGDAKTVTVTPLSVGSTTITVSQTSNNTGASFSFTGATFTVNVTAPAPANTAPSVSIAGVTAGDTYSKGSVPTATCNVTDTEDGPSSFAATLSAITGPYSSDGIGSQTASCSYTDAGLLTASASVTYSIVDPSTPVITYVLNPATPDGNNGWYKAGVTLTWTVTEVESPNSLSKTGCDDQNITSDQLETTYSCSAASAGGSATPVDVKIKRDGSAPDVTYTSASPVLPNGSNGWYTSNVTATFTATDNFSGVNGSATATATTSSEGASVSVGSPAFTDNAGNTTVAGTVNSAAYKIDLTDPSNVAFVGGPAAGGSYDFGSVPAQPTCTADDNESGLASCLVTGYSQAVGTQTMTATATDVAGRTSSVTRTYTVNPWSLKGFYQPVDMNGVYNMVKAGSTVPLKFELFAGSTELVQTSSIKSFTAAVVVCDGAALTDDIEVTTTGGTTLRYDATGGQFIQNWQTPVKPGTCYRVTMTTQDTSSLVAYFKLK